MISKYIQGIVPWRFAGNHLSRPTLAFSCGARSAFKLKEQGYLGSMLSRRQLQGFVRLRFVFDSEFH
jgi:hypothetical protein